MLKQKIKLIIFDISNVCFSMEEPPFITDFCNKHKINEKEFDEEYQALIKKAEVDEISGIKIWEIMLEKYKIFGNPKEIIAEMMDQKYEFTEVLDIVRKLKDTGIPVVYLSNYSKDYWDFIAKKWDMKDYFTSGLVSYEIKARTPAPAGFIKLMETFGSKPEETLFIDDSEGNLNKAKELGIWGHLFVSREELSKFLQREGLL